MKKRARLILPPPIAGALGRALRAGGLRGPYDLPGERTFSEWVGRP